MFTNPLTCLIPLKSETQFVRFDPRGQLYKQWKKTQSCPTLRDSMACNPPGFSVHGILQVRRLAWVATPFFRGSSQPRDQNQSSCSAGSLFVCLFLPSEPPGKPKQRLIQSRGFFTHISGFWSWRSYGTSAEVVEHFHMVSPYILGFLTAYWIQNIQISNIRDFIKTSYISKCPKTTR